MSSNSNKISKVLVYIPILIFFAYTAWWGYLNFLDVASKNNFDTQARYNFTDTYGLVALSASVVGMIISKKWGFLKSRFGKTLFYFSLGLFLQFTGQLMYGLFYRIGDVYLAFPSIGDIPYFLSHIAYILAIYNLLKVIVFNQSIFKPRRVLVVSVIATLILGVISYKAFLNIAIQDERGVIYQFLNVAYPFVQSIYFLTGIVALMQAKRISEGKLFFPVGLVLTALIVQYIADFNFLFQSYHESWKAAALNDLLFVTAYALMGMSIIMIDRVRRQVLRPANAETNTAAEVK
jgi:hypothetical protein